MPRGKYKGGFSSNLLGRDDGCLAVKHQGIYFLTVESGHKRDSANLEVALAVLLRRGHQLGAQGLRQCIRTSRETLRAGLN